MNEFKIGQYVMANIGCDGPDCWVLAKVVDIEDDDVIVELIDEQYREEETFSYIDLRQATNNDYFNTLTPEQKAKWITFRFNVICSSEYCKSRTCISTDCEDAVSSFLKDFYDGWRVE